MCYYRWLKTRYEAALDSALREFEKELAEHRKECKAKTPKMCPYERKVEKEIERKTKEINEEDDLTEELHERGRRKGGKWDSDSRDIKFAGLEVKSTGYYYDGDRRDLAHEVKKGDEAAITEAAERMSRLVPKDAILIPVPSHTGRATYTLAMAKKIADKVGCKVADILVGKERKPLYDLKKKGETPQKKMLGIKLANKTSIPSSGHVVFVDNVIDKGETARACYDAVGRGSVVVIAHGRDAEYIDAVSHGDDSRCARLVREAAARAMPNTKAVDADGLPRVYTHSTDYDFSVFETPWVYFSKEQNANEDYGSKAIRIFVNIENPIPMDNDQFPMLDGKRVRGYEPPSRSDAEIDMATLHYNGDIIEEFVKRGYDGMLAGRQFYNVAFHPHSQIKSADPVTYDDAGDPIPLSKRFDMNNPDIRY